MKLILFDFTYIEILCFLLPKINIKQTEIKNDFVYRTNKLNHCWMDSAWLWWIEESSNPIRL